jgi:hypothetical protein
MPANPGRGEVALSLPSGDIVLRPTFSALVAAESEVGSLLALLDRAGEGDVRLGDMGPLFWHASAAGGCSQDRAAFEAQLVEVGLAAVMPAYRLLLASVFGGRE